MKGELTSVELGVLAGAAAGETVDETSRRTHRALGTVKHHRRSAIAKLGARNVAHAISIAHARGLLDPVRYVEPVSPGQVRAFYAKLDKLVGRDELERAREKEHLYDLASQHTGRPVASLNELSSFEASWLLDEISSRLASSQRRSAAA